MKVHLSPGERNPIEGKFGQAKVAFGMNKIRAKLSSTSASWIAAIALVLNLVKLTRQALVPLIISLKNIIEIFVQNFKTYNLSIILKNKVLLCF